MEVAASAIAVITLVGNVSNICLRLYGSLGAREELNQIVKELDGLRHVLTVITQLTATDTGYAQVCSKSSLAKVIKDCEDEIKDLEAELKKVEDSKLPGLSLPWLLKEKALARRLDKLTRLKQDLQLSMQTDQTSLHLHTHREDEAFRSSFAEKERENQRRQIINWLDPAPFSSTCNDAQKTRTADTFTWLLESPSITAWRNNPHSNIWLHGIPGCGKTVFASSVVETLTAHCQQDRTRTLAYYFFEFGSRAKGTADSFLRSILSQTIAQNEVVPNAVQTLYTESSGGVRGPSEKRLLEVLHAVLNASKDVYLIVDAVDESENRTEILGILRQLELWAIPSLHLMATSRSEEEFENSFQGFCQVSLEGKMHIRDIRKYTRQRMQDGRAWSKWPINVQKGIAKVVVRKAGDMFRLAKLHLDALQKCKNIHALRQTIPKLPSTLDDTYARILASIDSEVRPDALRILVWLCFARRPPTLPELAATLAVDLETLKYNPMLEYQDANEIFGICGSLIKRSQEDGRHVVKLSHASVKDYLVSGRIGSGDFETLPMTPSLVNLQMCTICLVYLNDHNYENEDQARSRHQSDSLFVYATLFWPDHFRRAGDHPTLLQQARTLLLGHSSRFLRWSNIINLPPRSVLFKQLVTDPDSLQSRLNACLYLSAGIGSIKLIDDALNAGAQVNGSCGLFESALAVATLSGEVEAVKHLLNAGADVDLRIGHYGCVIHLASWSGQVELVDCFLSSGADLTIYGGIHRSALIAAVEREPVSTALVKRLLMAGANPSARVYNMTPLNFAVSKRSKALLELLIESGADCNDGSLQVAQRTGQLEMVQILIDAGADPNIGMIDGINMRMAARLGVSGLRFVFEDLGYGIDAVDDDGRTALHMAAYTGNTESIQYLLGLGFQCNTKDRKGWSAVHYAAMASKADGLRLLLPLWTLDTRGWTPLHLACQANTTEAIDLLLEAGLQPTSISTKQPPWNWSLFDIAAWHRNWNLVSRTNSPLHPAIHQDSRPPTHNQFRIGRSGKVNTRICDGCQPSPKITTIRNVHMFHCKECPDFDYCMVCVGTAAQTHPHSSWELLRDARIEVDLSQDEMALAVLRNEDLAQQTS
ncbi:ankyrin repeat-containing domain protein [Boeremia exigua]|uniref:ankyrin repeat-containing domain protein n=1 Tax=Boeremia exigua TaxID=749465 RepID=UPI001E8E7CAF|nr:ankyrin repeat-containing domain protein [Boeremia exigua]KAH6637503.1 ankyrin repeat-containing domain protein [Boeremia exigua]